jgi:5'-deoxynucleotidase YfbR-like HD superfamily hydrolase
MKTSDIIEKCWFRTFTGKIIDPENPKPEDIDPIDIARSLSNLCRFGGQVPEFYSVAQHSLFVAKIALDECIRSNKYIPNPEIERLIFKLGLLHDASESYLCDIPTPFKRLMPEYYKVEQRVMKTIYTRFGIPDSFINSHYKFIEKADKEALAFEMSYLFENDRMFPLAPMTSEVAFSTYLSALIKLS